ncbi:Hypothetical predicted protein [Cloeon dipterum]|uniref:26S proteasome non-ATPase regulatory subunit 5 n=1 Tax=Cloeon dipterum TaxID=197152 RepID=A0A8S1D3V5_9INSE|nr:Hypothetical predicted protein [Cloeon dipterum]
MDAAGFQSRIDSYAKCKDHKTVLNEFLNEVKGLSHEQRRLILPKLDFSAMFRTLVKWNNPIYAEPFYELVSLVFENCEAGRIVSENEELLLQFLTHVTPKFQVLLFSLLCRAISEGNVSCFSQVPNLMYELVRSISAEDADSDSPVLNLLEKIILMPRGAEIVFKSDIGNSLAEIMCEIPEIRFQILELASSAASGSKEGLEMVKNCQILEELETGLQGAMAHVDQVGFAATVDCYTKIGSAEWGYEELLASGILSKLEARVVEYGPGTMEDKVMPSIYMFFGAIFKHFPERALKDCPKVVPTVMNLIKISIDRAYVTRTEMEMIGMVAAKPAGKRYLATLMPSSDSVLDHLKKFVQSGSASDKVCSLETTMDLIVLKEEDQTDEMLKLTKSWFESIWISVEKLFQFCKEPFPGVNRTSIPVFVSETVQCRITGLKLLLTLTKLAWGRHEVCLLPSLLSWLVEQEACNDVHFFVNGVADAQVMQLKSDVARVILADKSIPQNVRRTLTINPQVQNDAKKMRCSSGEI